MEACWRTPDSKVQEACRRVREEKTLDSVEREARQLNAASKGAQTYERDVGSHGHWPSALLVACTAVDGMTIPEGWEAIERGIKR